MKWMIVVLLVLVTACASVSRRPEQLTEVHLQAKFEITDAIAGVTSASAEMGYLLYLPEGYNDNPDRRWPLIFFLHGAGDEDNDSGFVMSHGLPEVLYAGDQPDDFPFVVVSPQALPNRTWWDGDMPAILIALLDEVMATYQVDPDRIYLTGLSMGGYGSWSLATDYADRFAAVVSVSGSGYRTTTFPPLETLCRLGDVPIWAIHGAEDLISAPRASQLFADTLATSCDGDVEWTLYPDAGHFVTFARAYRDPEIYTWMLAHTR